MGQCIENTTVFNEPKIPICVAQVIGTFGGGGAQRLAYNLAIGLAERGWRSLAVALRKEGGYGETASQQVELITFRADPQKPLSIIRAFFSFRKLIRQKQVDLLHVHGASSLPFVVLATRFLKRRPKLMFTWHDSESVLGQKSWQKLLMVWALKSCDSLSASSRTVAQKLRNRGRLKQVSVFYGGVPIIPDSEGKVNPKPLIVWLGRIVPPKDPQILIRAAAKLRAESLQFSVCILGAPSPSTNWYLDETRALIEKLGLGDVVHMPGFAADDELKKIMTTAGIYVQTSHTEGLSLALLESMTAGLAIVATDVGDTAVAVENNLTGILIPPKDETSLTEALRQLLINVDLRNQLASEARQCAVKRFSIQAMVDRTAGEYHTLIMRT